MIRLSRSGVVPSPSRPRAPRWERVFRAWHIACIPLFSGCLYVTPIQYRTVNRPPQIVFPKNVSEPVDLYVFSQATKDVWVQAYDPDGDVLTFSWSIPRAGLDYQEFTDTLPSGDWKSLVLIPSQYLVEGESIEVLISDQGEPPERETVQWQVQGSL